MDEKTRHSFPARGCGAGVESVVLREAGFDYLEYHAADHCNMDCAGYTHYSPYFAGVEGGTIDGIDLECVKICASEDDAMSLIQIGCNALQESL